MPQIPLYQQQAAPAAARPFQVSQTGAAAQAGQIDQAGELLMRRGAQLADQFDTVQATQAYNAWREDERKVMADPNGGLLLSEGSNAYGVQDRYKEWFDSSINKSRTKLANDRQIAMFDKLSGNHRETSLNTLASHEIHQHRAIQKDAETGIITNGIVDVRQTALDQTLRPVSFDVNGKTITIEERPADSYIRQTKEAVAKINSGFVNTKQLAAIEQQGRISQIEAMIDSQAFGLAQKEIETQKVVLGEHYHTLSSRMKGVVQGAAIEGAYGSLFSKNGSNHEASLTAINNPKNWSTLFPGLSTGQYVEAAEKLNARFSDMLGERERQRSIIETNHERSIKQNDARVYADWLEGKPVDLPKLARSRVISLDLAQTLHTSPAGTKEDNFEAVTEIENMIKRQEDPTQRLSEMTSGDNPLLKKSTASTFAKSFVDEEYRRAVDLVDSATKPGEFDKFDADKNLKYTRVKQEFYTRIANKEGYMAAAQNSIAAFYHETNASWKNLPAPELLKGARNDAAALEAAKEATIAAAKTKGIPWYNDQMKKISALEEVVKRVNRVNESQQKLDEALNKKLK